MIFRPQRRPTIPVRVGQATIGGSAPVLIQSMTVTNPRDVEATVAETLQLAQVGCELVRITAPTVRDAQALQEVMSRVRAAGCQIPVSADIHFQPRAAFEALKWVEKVRINPGNFCDTGIMTLKEISDAEFQVGRQRVFDQFGPFVREAQQREVALRIGVNHGSLSGRMLYRYGDTIEGMVESALEYLAVCEGENFHQIVFSMKASHPRVAFEAYRLLAHRLDAEGHQPYPFHVGVTEAGEGEDGRMKSAVGIGGLLLDGIGDTIRVSLTEAAVEEIPVAQSLLQGCLERREQNQKLSESWYQDLSRDPFYYERRKTLTLTAVHFEIGGEAPIRVGGLHGTDVLVLNSALPDRVVELLPDRDFEVVPFESLLTHGVQSIGSIPVEIQVSTTEELEQISSLAKLLDRPVLWSWIGPGMVTGTRALAAALQRCGLAHPLVLRTQIGDQETHKLEAAAELGNLLCDGIGDVVLSDDLQFSYDLLQSAGLRRTKTEFVSCPGCGRTLFEIQTVLAGIKTRFGHLRGVSIAVMGCIVNGPGEMADADFGYVGGAPGKVSLYEGKTLVKKNIPADDALNELEQLIRARGRWTETVES